MNVGDVVRYQHKRWRVLSHSRELRTCILIDFDGLKAEVPDDLDLGLELKVLYNPTDWPFTSISVNTRFGRVVRISRSTPNNDGTGSSDTVALIPMVDWIPGDFAKNGGSIFFNPALGLKPGNVLIADHQNGQKQRIQIARGFASIKKRVKRANAKKAAIPSDNYQRILKDDVFGED